MTIEQYYLEDKNNALRENTSIPSEFICPITCEVMIEPLYSKYGQSFERSAILAWLREHNNTCPLTRQELKVSDLIRNRQIQSRIEAHYRARNLEYLLIERRNNDTIGDITSSSGYAPDTLLTCMQSDVMKCKKSQKKNKANQSQNENDADFESSTLSERSSASTLSESSSSNASERSTRRWTKFLPSISIRTR
jgi:hypothetical protein